MLPVITWHRTGDRPFYDKLMLWFKYSPKLKINPHIDPLFRRKARSSASILLEDLNQYFILSTRELSVTNHDHPQKNVEGWHICIHFTVACKDGGLKFKNMRHHLFFYCRQWIISSLNNVSVVWLDWIWSFKSGMYNLQVNFATEFFVVILLMTSSNGNIFRVTGPLCREFTGQRWILLTKASEMELWCFLWSAPE